MNDRFYTYTGKNEARQPATLHIDLTCIAAVHELPDGVVYLEGEAINWTLRPKAEDVAPLVEQWQRARAA